jgi:hypothetical protein
MEIASFHGGMVKAKKTCKPNIILKVIDLFGRNEAHAS